MKTQEKYWYWSFYMEDEFFQEAFKTRDEVYNFAEELFAEKW